MILSKLAPFLSNPKIKPFKRALQNQQVFGLGVSWDGDQNISSVRLIVRDKYSAESFKKFAVGPDEKAVTEFFSTLSKEQENPDDGLHGNLFALKIDSKLELSRAFYRRLENTPVSFEGGQWFKYRYEELSKYSFSTLKVPIDEKWRNEVKFDFTNRRKGNCLYPIYSKVKQNDSLKLGIGSFFQTYGGEIFEKVSNIGRDAADIETTFKMNLVSVGESGDSIKAYFIDFDCQRLLLAD